MRPKRSTAASARALQASGSVMSVGTAIAWPPVCLDGLRDLVQRVLRARTERDVRALRGAGQRDRSAQAGADARHHHDAVLHCQVPPGTDWVPGSGPALHVVRCTRAAMRQPSGVRTRRSS